MKYTRIKKIDCDGNPFTTGNQVNHQQRKKQRGLDHKSTVGEFHM